jgi:hypothetical protein
MSTVGRSATHTQKGSRGSAEKNKAQGGVQKKIRLKGLKGECKKK